jgi:putative spermidine/putrescine transport system permease protein
MAALDRSARPYSGSIVVLSALVVGFLLLPVLFIVAYAFNETRFFALPPKGLTLHWFANFFANDRFRAALQSSLSIAALVTPASLAIAMPSAIAIVRGSFRGRELLNAALLSPLVIPGIVTGIAFLSLFSQLDVGSGFWRLSAALTCFTLPFAVRALVANLHGLDPALEEAARNLGASRWRCFLHVTLPQLRPGLLAGGIFVFVEAIDNFSIAVFLTDLRTTTLPVEAYNYIRDFDDPTVAAMATLLIGLTVALVFLVQRVVGLDRFLDLK